MTTEATPGALGSNDQLGPLLEDALGAYWDAAYAEGRSRRTHDTEDGAAQTALLQVRVAVAALIVAERERSSVLTDDMLRYAMAALGTGSPREAERFRAFWLHAMTARDTRA